MKKNATISNVGMDDGGTNAEKYLHMNEREKDIEIQKAVDRLQKRIQAILYALDKGMPRALHSEPEQRPGKQP